MSLDCVDQPAVSRIRTAIVQEENALPHSLEGSGAEFVRPCISLRDSIGQAQSHVVHQQVRMEISSDGIREATGIVAFWMISGLRMAFVSNGNEQGSWIFRIIHGKPAHLDIAMQQLLAAKLWVFLWSAFVTLGACLTLRAIAPPQLLTLTATASQMSGVKRLVWSATT